MSEPVEPSRRALSGLAAVGVVVLKPGNGLRWAMAIGVISDLKAMRATGAWTVLMLGLLGCEVFAQVAPPAPQIRLPQLDVPRRLPDCEPPAKGSKVDLQLKDYPLGGAIIVGMPANWSRYDVRPNDVTLFGPTGESMKATWGPGREWGSYVSRRIAGARVPLPMPISGYGDAVERREFSFSVEFLSPHIGSVLSTVRLAIEPIGGYYVAIEEQHPVSGSCVPGMFEAVRKAIRVTP